MLEEILGGEDAIINILGGIGFFAVTLITVYVMWVYVKKIKTDKSEGQLAEENWDGIGEYKNDLPTGWVTTTVVLMVWAIWYYLVGYPVNGYSQIGQWNKEVNEYNAKFSATWDNADDATLKKMGKSIFLSNCAQCHGNDANGMNGKAANLVEFGRATQIKNTIMNGSMGSGYNGGEMPNRYAIVNMETGTPISDSEIDAVSNYVANGMKGNGEVFKNYCASCHGANGEGVQDTFPSLANYEEAHTIRTIKNGRHGKIGVMPAFGKTIPFTEVQYKALAKYILATDMEEI
jgi:cytochrome c oxidase cbb3-type subunit 3